MRGRVKRWVGRAMALACAALPALALWFSIQPGGQESGLQNAAVHEPAHRPGTQAASRSRLVWPAAATDALTTATTPSPPAEVTRGAPRDTPPAMNTMPLGPASTAWRDLTADARRIELAARRRTDENAQLRTTPAERLSDDDLVFLAALVEREAQSRTDRLAARYNLSAAQQDRVFTVYARASQAYHSAMTIVTDSPVETPRSTEVSDAGSETGSAESTSTDEAIYEVLDAAQQAEYEQDVVDRDLWWSEVIGQLEGDLDTEAAAAAAEGDTADPEGDAGDVDPHAGGSLFDLLGP